MMMLLDFADLIDTRLDSDAVFLAAEACRRYIMRCSCRHPSGIRATDLFSACKRHLAPLSQHDRDGAFAWLVRMPTIATKMGCGARGRQDGLRFWRVDLAPEDAFTIDKRKEAARG